MAIGIRVGNKPKLMRKNVFKQMLGIGNTLAYDIMYGGAVRKALTKVAGTEKGAAIIKRYPAQTKIIAGLASMGIFITAYSGVKTIFGIGVSDDLSVLDSLLGVQTAYADELVDSVSLADAGDVPGDIVVPSDDYSVGDVSSSSDSIMDSYALSDSDNIELTEPEVVSEDISYDTNAVVANEAPTEEFNNTLDDSIGEEVFVSEDNSYEVDVNNDGNVDADVTSEEEPEVVPLSNDELSSLESQSLNQVEADVYTPFRGYNQDDIFTDYGSLSDDNKNDSNLINFNSVGVNNDGYYTVDLNTSDNTHKNITYIIVDGKALVLTSGYDAVAGSYGANGLSYDEFVAAVGNVTKSENGQLFSNVTEFLPIPGGAVGEKLPVDVNGDGVVDCYITYNADNTISVEGDVQATYNSEIGSAVMEMNPDETEPYKPAESTPEPEPTPTPEPEPEPTPEPEPEPIPESEPESTPVPTSESKLEPTPVPGTPVENLGGEVVSVVEMAAAVGGVSGVGKLGHDLLKNNKDNNNSDEEVSDIINADDYSDILKVFGDDFTDYIINYQPIDNYVAMGRRR